MENWATMSAWSLDDNDGMSTILSDEISEGAIKAVVFVGPTLSRVDKPSRL